MLKMRRLSDLNYLNNFQDVAIPCEIIKIFFEFITKNIQIQPWREEVVASNRNISLALSRKTEVIQMSENLLSGGFPCINTRVGFDTDNKEMNRRRSFHLYKRNDLKLLYRLKMNVETNLSDRRMIRKVIKLD